MRIKWTPQPAHVDWCQPLCLIQKKTQKVSKSHKKVSLNIISPRDTRWSPLTVITMLPVANAHHWPHSWLIPFTNDHAHSWPSSCLTKLMADHVHIWPLTIDHIGSHAHGWSHIAHHGHRWPHPTTLVTDCITCSSLGWADNCMNPRHHKSHSLSGAGKATWIRKAILKAQRWLPRTLSKTIMTKAQWFMPVTPALRRMKQEDATSGAAQAMFQNKHEELEM